MNDQLRQNRSWIDMETVQSFKDAVDAGSLSAAARQSSITQAAMSLRIKRLEAFLDAAVLRRGKNKSLVVTEIGALVLKFYNDVLFLDQRLKNDIDKSKGNFTSIKIGIQFDLRHPDLPKLFKYIRMESLNIEITTASSAVLKEKITGMNLDFAVLTSYDEIGRFIKYQDIDWIAACNSTLPLERPLPVIFIKDSVFGEMARKLLIEAGIEWRSSFEATSFLEVDLAVQADIGVSAALVGERLTGVTRIPLAAGLPPFPPIGIRVLRSSRASSPTFDFVEEKLFSLYQRSSIPQPEDFGSVDHFTRVLA